MLRNVPILSFSPKPVTRLLTSSTIQPKSMQLFYQLRNPNVKYKLSNHFSTKHLIILTWLCTLGFAYPAKTQDHSTHDNHPGFVTCELMAKYETANTKVPNKYLSFDKKSNQMMRSSAVAAQTATINVIFGPGAQANPEAQAAFQFAIDIWASTVVSSVPINVFADFANLGSGVLAQAGPTFIFRNFMNAPVPDVWYPSALAESLAGEDLVGDPNEPDLSVSLGNGFDWYFGTDMNPGPSQFDFVTVALHEIGHGMGFVGGSSFDVTTGNGSIRLGGPPNILIYSDFVILGDATPITNLPDPSVELGDALIGGDLFVNGANTLAGNGGNPSPLYAPSPYQGGSSYSHWDEAAFPAGNPNSLMTPQLGQAESIYDVGDNTRGFFKDTGWGINDADLNPIIATPNSLQEELFVDETASQTINLSNISDNTLDFQLTIDPAVNWLSLNPISGTLASAETIDITANFDATGQPKGIYNTEILVIPAGFPDADIRVAVQLRVLDGTEAPVIAVNPESFNKTLSQFSFESEVLNVANQGDDDLNITVSISDLAEQFKNRVISSNQNILQHGFQQLSVSSGGSSPENALTNSSGIVNQMVSTQYATDFEDFTLGDILDQQGWFARFTDNWIISDANPSDGSLHFRGQSDGNGPNQPAIPLALSPTVPIGNEVFSTLSARVELNGTGVTWEIIPQSNTVGFVNTRLRFGADGSITVLDARTSSFVPVNASIPTGYFDLKIVVDRTTFDLRIFFDNTLVFSGLAFAGDIEQLALLSNMEVAGPTMDLDKVQILDGDPDAFWLSVSPNSGTVGIGSSLDLNVNFDARVFEPGVYNANILIDSDDPNNPQETVPVSLTILTPPTISVDPESLDAAVDVTQSDPPVDIKTLTITNVGESDLEFNAAPGVSVLNGSPNSSQAGIEGLDMTKYGLGNDPNMTPSSIAMPPNNIQKLQLIEPQNAVFIDSIFYDSGVNVAGDYVGLQGPAITTAMRFDVDRPTFVLSAVRNSFRTEDISNPVTILEIYKGGDEPSQGDLLMVQTLDFTSADGSLFLEELNQSFTFNSGEHFWVVHKYPEGIFFPQGFDELASGRPNTYFFSSDGGVTYNPADDFPYLTRALSGGADDSFITLEPTSGVIPPNGSLEVSVTFDATGIANGTYSTAIDFTSNDPVTPVLTVPTLFEVSGQVAGIAVSDELLLFGDVFIGADKTLCFTILNDGLSELEISDILSDNPEFTLDVGPIILAAGDSVKVSVTYTPSEPGNSNAVISINSNAPGEETIEVVAGGVGSEPPVMVISPDKVTTAADAGEVVVESIIISNEGNSPLTFSFPEISANSILADPNRQKNNTDIIEFSQAPQSKGELDTRVGHPVILNAGTDNEFGYTWIASNEEGGPVFSWEDITTDGTDVTLDVGGDGNIEVDLPFEFPFYGASYSKVRIAGNGFLTFQEITASFGAFLNQQIPTVGNPDAIIAPFWYDIEPNTGLLHYLGSEDKFTVQYTAAQQFPSSPGETVTFQVVLYPDGSIEYYYLDVETASFITLVTVGIENADGTDGAQVVFNNSFLQDNLAVRFVAPSRPLTPFITEVTPLSGVVAPGGEKVVEVVVDATELNHGTYFDDLVVSSNDPINSPTTVPFTLEVTGFPEIAITPEELIFDPLFLGLSSQQSLSVANAGTKELEITSISNINPDYTIDPLLVIPTSIAPGDSIQVMVTFTPTSLGNIEDMINVQSNDAFGNEMTTVNVSGIGLDPPVISVNPESVEAEVIKGASTEVALTITNNGNSDLIYTAIPPFFGTFETNSQVPVGLYPEMKFARIISKETPDDRVGPPVVNASGGPGTFGYTWVDNNSGGPEFDFIDISGSGIPVDVGNDGAVVIGLPFNFPFFGEDRNVMVIAANGFLTFQGELGPFGGFSNAPIPTMDAPNDVIAGLWDDIEPQDGGGVFIQGDSESVIVQYQEVPKFFGDPLDVVTFQIILYSDGSIKMQYKTVGGTASALSSTVGLEGQDGTKGLQVLFNSPFLEDGLAISFTPPTTGTLAPGESADISVVLDATRLEEGIYQDNILVESNDPVTPLVTVPVALTVNPRCDTPDSPTVSDITINSAQFDWNQIADALEYEFQYRPITGEWISVFTTDHSLSLTDLAQGTEHQFKVRSICSDDRKFKSRFSRRQKFITEGELACQMPTDLEVSNITDTNAEASWAAANGAIKYLVFYKYSKTPWQKMFVSGLTVVLDDLFPGTTYKMRVQSICSENNASKSEFSETISFTTTGYPACGTPDAPILTAVGSTSASFVWRSDVNGAVNFELSYKKDGEPWTFVWAHGSQSTIAGLEPGTKYRVRLRTLCSLNGQFVSDFSSTIRFTTLNETEGMANARTVLEGQPEDELQEATKLSIYPNPSIGVVNMEMPLAEGERVSIKVFSVHGSLITSRDVSNALNEQFDFSDLAKGVYMAHISSNIRGNMVRRLILE